MSEEKKLPPVGSSAFRSLEFKNQLELVSLKLFNPSSYREKTGDPNKLDLAYEDSRIGLLYPDNPLWFNSSVEDFPVTFLRNYWAGYICSYKEDWYFKYMKGTATPLDEYGIDYGYMVNLRTFTFPLMSVTWTLFLILSWISRNFFKGEINDETVLDACKVYNWIATNQQYWELIESDSSGRMPMSVYKKAMSEYIDILMIDDLNSLIPTVEESDEVDFLENREFVVFPVPRPAGDRYFYPMIPAKLYVTSKFHITSWGWVDEGSERHDILTNP